MTNLFPPKGVSPFRPLDQHLKSPGAKPDRPWMRSSCRTGEMSELQQSMGLIG